MFKERKVKNCKFRSDRRWVGVSSVFRVSRVNSQDIHWIV